MLRQRTPWDLTRLARQVSPHDLVMGGISLAGSRQLDLTFFPLRAFLGILAHFSMWNLESFYPGNPSEWLLIRIALDVRLMRSDIYMTFNLIIKNTLSSQWPKYMHVCSFLQTVLKFPLCSLCKYWVSTLEMHHEHSRHDFLPLDFCLPEIMKRFPYVIYWFFLPFHLDYYSLGTDFWFYSI